MNKCLIFALVLVYVCVVKASVEKCYTCKNQECNEFNELTCSTMNLLGELVCYTVKATANGVTGISKGCTPKQLLGVDFCKATQVSDNIECSTCSEDLCNSSMTIYMSMLLVTLCSIFVKFLN